MSSPIGRPGVGWEWTSGGELSKNVVVHGFPGCGWEVDVFEMDEVYPDSSGVVVPMPGGALRDLAQWILANVPEAAA